MTLFALLLALSTSFAWAGFDAVRKRVAAAVPPIPLVIFFSAGQALLMGSWLLLNGRPIVEPGYLLPYLGTTAFNVLGNLCFVWSVAASPLSLTVPYLSLSPVFTILSGLLLLGEWPTPLQAIGILVVVIGAMSLSAEKGAGLAGVWRNFAADRGRVLMVGAAASWALAAPMDKLAVQASDPAFHATAVSAGIAVVLLALLAARGGLGGLKSYQGNAGWIWLSAILGTAAFLIQMYAYQATLVSLVEAIKRVVGIFMAVLLGRLFFAEPVTRQKIIAIVLLSFGVTLMLI